MTKCKVIAIANQKGGTGKSTTAVNLGVGLAMHDKKTLIIDFDPQADTTTCLGWRDTDKLPVTVSNVMEKVIQDQTINPADGILHHVEGVDLMPSNIELSGMEVTLANVMSRELTLKHYVDTIRKNYDYIVIDTMPSLGMLTINALAASDSVIIPVQAQYLPAKGMTQLLKTIGKVQRQINPTLKVDGILLTISDSRTRIARQTALKLREDYGNILNIYGIVIPIGVKLAEMSASGQSIYAYEKNSTVAKAYEAFTKEVIQQNERVKTPPAICR